MAQYLWPQDDVDDVKQDPCQAAFLSGPIVDLRSRQYHNDEGLSRGEVESALTEVSPEDAEKIKKILFSKRFKFNRVSKEAPIGLALVIPDFPNQLEVVR